MAKTENRAVSYIQRKEWTRRSMFRTRTEVTEGESPERTGGPDCSVGEGVGVERGVHAPKAEECSTFLRFFCMLLES